MSYITLDFETYYGNKYTLTSMTYEEYIFHPDFFVHGVGFKIDNQPTVYYPDAEVATVLKELFYPGNPHTLIAHNAMFDGAILSWHYNLHAAKYWCTKAMSQALFPQFKHNLKALAQRLWPDDEAARKGEELESFKNIKRLNAEQQQRMGAYCIQDVDLTFAAAQHMFGMLPVEEIEAIEWTLHQFIEPVITVNRTQLETFLNEHRIVSQATIDASGTTRTVLASNLKFAAWLKATHGIEIPLILSPTPKDPENEKLPMAKQDEEFINLQLDNPELEHVWRARMTATSNIAERRAERMLKHSSFFEDNVLPIPLNYYSAHTGRWGGTNKINPQNLQAGSVHRTCLTAPQGYKVAVADLANIEGRVLAWFARQEDKCHLFNQGVDLYNRIASEVYGRPIDRKRKAYRENGDVYYPDATEGFVGKTLELGLGYRMGPRKLRHSFLVGGRETNRLFFSLEQCQQFVRVYRTLNDKIEQSWRHGDAMIHHMTQRHEAPVMWRCVEVGYRYIKLPNGMYLTYPELKAVEDDRGDVSYMYWNGKFMTHIHGGKLIENIIQALSRIIMNDGRRRVSEYLHTYKDPTVRVIMTVHDELVALVLNESATKDWEKMGELMCVLPDWANDGLLTLETAGGVDDCYSK